MKTIDLANVSLDRLALLIYGEYGAGKTRFLRDVIETEQGLGPDHANSVLYVSFAGDEGYLPLKGLNVPAVELDDPADIGRLIDKYTKKPLHLLCVDGLDKFSDLSMIGTIGSDRTPRTGSAKENEWGGVHRDFLRSLARLRKCASYFVATSPADRYTNPVTGDSRLYPDLPGSQAARVIGSFDFAIGLELKTGPTGKPRRYLRVKPTGDSVPVAFKLRQRLVNELTEDIEIPEGGGAWSVLKDQIAAAMK